MASTIEAFGPHACLKHAALYSHNAHAIHSAAGLYPNATVYLGARACLSNRTRLEFSSAEDMLQHAKDLFQNDLKYRPIGHRPPPTTDKNDNAAFLWTIFTALPQKAIHNARLEHIAPKLGWLCEVIAETQQLPRPRTLTTLLQQPRLFYNAPTPLLHAFIRQGPAAQSENTNEETEGQLLELQSLIQSGMNLVKQELEPNHTAKLIIQNNNHDRATWEALLAAALKDKSSPDYKPRRRTKAPNYMEMEETFRNPTADDIIMMATESPSWSQGPNKSFKLFGPDPERPYLEIAQDEHHNLHLTAAEPLSNLPTIPTTHQTQPAFPGKNRIERLLHQGAANAFIQTALTHLRENWGSIRSHPNLHRPTADRAAGAISSALRSDRSQANYINQPYKLAKDIDIALGTMALQPILAEARKYTDQITTFHYNTVMNLGDELTKLARTNPGAVSWAMNHAQPRETVRHPGQLITLARKSLHDAGLHPHHWKFVAALDHPIIKETPQSSTEMLAAFLNGMAAANAAPPPDTAAFILNMVLASAYRKAITYSRGTEEEKTLTKANIVLLLTLLCRQYAEVQNTTEILDQALDVMDYVLSASEKQTPIRSTTWNGITKASHHWHRDTRQAEILDEWERKRGKRHGLLSWKSLMGPTRKGNLEITPLTNEFQLFQEAREMNHCVVNYARNCVQGDRIFSISRGGVKLATSQITRTPQGYQEVQTRGRDNHDVTPDIKEAMQEIAAYYELATLEEERSESVRTYPDNLQ